MCSAGNSLATHNFKTHYSPFEISSKSSHSIVLKMLFFYAVFIFFLKSVTAVQIFQNVNMKQIMYISNRTIGGGGGGGGVLHVDGTTTHCCTVTFKEERAKVVSLCVQSFRSEFKCTGKAVGVILKSFKIFPFPFFFFFFSGISALSCVVAGASHYCVKVLVLLWPGSIVKQLVFISVGERQDRVSSPLLLQMRLDQGKLTMCFVFFKTLM